MITKQIAMELPNGRVLHHVRLKNADGSPVRARVNGHCQTWVRRPDKWRLPMKHGLKQCFDITPSNAHEWVTAEQEDDAEFMALHLAVLAGDAPYGILEDKCRDMGIMA